MSCAALDIEPAVKNVTEELGVFSNGIVKAYSVRPPEDYKPTDQAFWCTRCLHGIVCNSGRLENSEHPNNLSRDVRGACFFVEGNRNFKFLDSLLHQELESLDDHGCPKFQDLVAEEMWICSS